MREEILTQLRWVRTLARSSWSNGFSKKSSIPASMALPLNWVYVYAVQQQMYGTCFASIMMLELKIRRISLATAGPSISGML